MHRMPLGYRVLCWCSGARLYILRQCPTDYNKYAGIGAIVIATGIMATLSGGYALYTVFNQAWLAILFGLFWGTLIFFLDWYIVSSLRKEKRFVREMATALPRLVLAILLGFIISKPLEIKLFEPEISHELENLKIKRSIQHGELMDAEYDEIDRVEEENRRLLDDLKTKEDYRNQLFQLIMEEAEGRSPTGKTGKGPVYREKREEFEKIDQIYQEERKRGIARIDENTARLEDMRERKAQQAQISDKSLQAYGGFLARLEALGELSRGNRTIARTSLFIILLFIVIESAPIIVKLISRRGPYDETLEAEELSIARVAREKKHQNHIELEKLAQTIDLPGQIEEYKKATQLVLEKEYLDASAMARREVDALKIASWQEQETKKITEQKVDLHNPVESERVNKSPEDNDNTGIFYVI
jgi:hypothetical protein